MFTEHAQPAAYYPPIPVEFVVVTGGRFEAHLTGADQSLVERAAWHLAAAATDNGIGAKTASGFGFFATTAKTGARE